MAWVGGNPRFRQCPKCLSIKGTFHDCDHCEQVCCSECSVDIGNERVLCGDCSLELARRVADDSEEVLGLMAQALAERVLMALQSDLQELHLMARAGCTPEETRTAMARDWRES